MEVRYDIRYLVFDREVSQDHAEAFDSFVIPIYDIQIVHYFSPSNSPLLIPLLYQFMTIKLFTIYIRPIHPHSFLCYTYL